MGWRVFFVNTSNVANADAVLIVSFYVGRDFIDVSALFYGAVEAYNVVVTYLVKTSLFVP